MWEHLLPKYSYVRNTFTVNLIADRRYLLQYTCITKSEGAEIPLYSVDVYQFHMKSFLVVLHRYWCIIYTDCMKVSACLCMDMWEGSCQTLKQQHMLILLLLSPLLDSLSRNNRWTVLEFSENVRDHFTGSQSIFSVLAELILK